MIITRICIRFSISAVRNSRGLSAASPAPIEGVPTNEGPSASVPGENRSVAPHIQALVDQIANLPLLDVADLNYALKKKLNLPDAPMMPAGMMMAAASARKIYTFISISLHKLDVLASAASAESKDDDVPQKMTFAVKLAKFDDSKKIALIKEIRNIMPNLNLVQAKKFVETAPVEVKNDLGKAEAEELKAALEKCGATVEIV